jgi:hypothetical protein
MILGITSSVSSQTFSTGTFFLSMLTFALTVELVQIRLPIQDLWRRGEIELCMLTTTRASSVRRGHRICCPEDLPITRARHRIGSLHQRPQSPECPHLEDPENFLRL